MASGPPAPAKPGITPRASIVPTPQDPLTPIGDTLDARSNRSMRETITTTLIGTLCAVIALAFITMLLAIDDKDLQKRIAGLKTVLDVVLGPLIALLSTVIGFYFGAKSVEDSKSAK